MYVGVDILGFQESFFWGGKGVFVVVFLSLLMWWL
jgi:hypothetical protein